MLKVLTYYYFSVVSRSSTARALVAPLLSGTFPALVCFRRGRRAKCRFERSLRGVTETV
ncbi:unnamed protein product [Tenebrio molitor]|nr:unnamed protein product [Tenebrio molitor]